MSNVEKKVNIIKADYRLQSKIGSGPLNPQTIERCQAVMEANVVDFVPIAAEYLALLEGAIADAKDSGGDVAAKKAAMTTPVMQLKANASMFNYPLIGGMATIMLSFLEGVEDIDDDVIAIVSAHHKTLSAIVANKMSGDGGQYGAQMQQELKAACDRYFAKRS